MTYRPWIEGECCGVCGRSGDPQYFDGGLIAFREPVRWACSIACYENAGAKAVELEDAARKALRR